MNAILILSDGRMGHVNQSIALAKYLRLPYDIVEVTFKNKVCKLLSKVLSYVFDRTGMYTSVLFRVEVSKVYPLVIGTGSTTYYPTKVLAKKMQAKSITMMLPKGYRLDFDTMFAQNHDTPPRQKNIIEIPANFAYVEPMGIYTASKKSIGIIIGGDNKVFHLSVEELKKQLDFIKTYYEGYEFAITTSPRTSDAVEKLVESYHFDYEVIFSKNAINPIADFLEQCETVCITGDSTSMISEAISYGEANVIVLPLKSTQKNKFVSFIDTLAKEGYLHIFDGTIKNKSKKIDFTQYSKQMKI